MEGSVTGTGHLEEVSGDLDFVRFVCVTGTGNFEGNVTFIGHSEGVLGTVTIEDRAVELGS